MKQFTAGKNDEGVRLSRFVEKVTTGLPMSLLYKSFRNKRVKVNGKKAAPEQRLCEGDVVELYINDEFFADAPPAPATHKRRKSKFSLQIVYEDANIAVLYKPAHLLCHSDRTGDASLVEMFQAYLEEKGEYTPHAENGFAPALCNRLDRGTEGLVIAAKNYAALRDMNTLIRDDLVEKEYLCITVGAPPQGVHTAYLCHNETHNKVHVRATPAQGYKEIRTRVQVLRTTGPFCLCAIGLLTGRTHQIRAHLAFLNAPILGDIKYGNAKMNRRTQTETQALCAAGLRFGSIPAENVLHALSGKEITLETPAVLTQFAKLDRHTATEK
jgi:23S rRNA pseudouridine955/2504/2580 synthase